VVIALLNDLYVCSHLNDVSIDRLVVEVLNALVVYICLTCRCVCRNNTAVFQSIVICNCAAAECVCKEILCKVNIRAVGCDIQGSAAVTCISFFTGKCRHCCDLPFTAVSFYLLNRRDDPVTVHNTCNLIALDCFVCVVRPAVRHKKCAVFCHLNQFFYNRYKSFILCDVRLAVLKLGYALSLHHHVRKVISVAVHTKKSLACLVVNSFTDLHELVPCTACQVVDRISCFLQNICTVRADNCTIVYRHSVMLAVDRGVVKLLSCEIIPVDVDVSERCPCIRIISYISLDVVILEQHHIRKVAIVAC